MAKCKPVTAEVVCHALVKLNDGVDLEKFIKQDNDFILEPKNSDGVVISMIPKSVKLISKGGKKVEELSDKLDRYMHFSFCGVKFCVDTEDRVATCDSMQPKVCGVDGHEYVGVDTITNICKLNVETSN